MQSRKDAKNTSELRDSTSCRFEVEDLASVVRQKFHDMTSAGEAALAALGDWAATRFPVSGIRSGATGGADGKT
jgi:hypothetical protein